MPRKFLIDTDTASDDAVALIMAMRWPDVEVEAITVVAGNVPVEQATKNALYVTDLCGKTILVYIGLDDFFERGCTKQPFESLLRNCIVIFPEHDCSIISHWL